MIQRNPFFKKYMYVPRIEHIFFFIYSPGNYVARHLQNVTKVDKPNPYVRWVDRWESIPDTWKPTSDESKTDSGRNCSVPQPLLVYNKVPRVSKNV